MVKIIIISIFFLLGCHVQQNDYLSKKKEMNARVEKWCRNAYPLVMPKTGYLYLPDMDDKTLLAANKLARSNDVELYSNLAGVLVRYLRLKTKRTSIGFLFDDTEDVSRLFSVFCYRDANFRISELIFLNDVVKHIIQKSKIPTSLSSDFLNEEIKIYIKWKEENPTVWEEMEREKNKE